MVVNSSLIEKQLNDLADKLQIHDAATAAQLRDLGDAVTGGPSQDAWVMADIFKLIDPQRLLDRVRSHTSRDELFAGLEIIRNAIVFLPILVTWVGIARAVESYRDLLAEQPELQAKPFLYLWQSGFEGRLPWLTLSRLGLIGGVLLLAVFILTLVVLLRSAQVNRRNDQQAEQLQTEIVQVLSNASLALGMQRAQQPFILTNRFDSIAQQILTEIAAERQRIVDLANERQQQIADISSFSTALKQSSQELANTAQTLQQPYQQLIASIQTLATHVQRMDDQIADLIASSTTVAGGLGKLHLQQQSVEAQIQATTQTLAASSTQVAAATLRIADGEAQLRTTQTQLVQALSDEVRKQTEIIQLTTRALGELNSSVQPFYQVSTHLSKQLDTFLPPIESLTTQTTTLVTAAHQAAQPLVGIFSQQQALAPQLRQTVDFLSNSVTAVATAAQQITLIAEQQMKAQTDFSQFLVVEREAQTRMANVVSSSAIAFDQAHLSIQDVATNLRAIAVDMSDLARNLAAQRS